MQLWHLDQSRCRGDIPCSRAAALLTAAGGASPDALAAEILRTVSDVAPITQCVIFAYESTNRPRLLGGADHRSVRFSNSAAELYARAFYFLDGNQKVVAGSRGRPARSPIVIHRQDRRDITHDGYRAACYERLDIDDRLALLSQPVENIWLSVNLYRGRDQGHFRPAEIATVESLAPILAHAARHHYLIAGQVQQEIPQIMLARVRAVCPALSKRELDVVGGVIAGRTAQGIAETMGIKASSVLTYRKRAYQRLGISSQRELFALAVAHARPI